MPVGLNSSSERSRLNLLLSLTQSECIGCLGWLGLKVKVHNLCRVKTKYLAVSPVTDNFEQLDKDWTEESHHHFQEVKKLTKWRVVMVLVGFILWCQLLKRKLFFKDIGENLLYANRQKLHLARYACRCSLAIYIHHSVICQYIICTDPLWLHIPKMQDHLMKSEDSFRTRVYNQHVLPVAHEDDEAQWSTMFSAVILCILLALSYASCKTLL